jgi:murein DD-endopeptidase MepM/ murein hydrolase activator NlpD
VLIGGDMNTHADYTGKPWSAVAKMTAAGYGWYSHSVDFIFYPRADGVRLTGSWQGSMVSDHHWIAVRLAAVPLRPARLASAPLRPAGLRPARLGLSAGGCGQVVYPVPGPYTGSDRHNWHSAGQRWSSWHTGTDFSVPCGTPVYAAHAGLIEIDTTQAWAGPWLVRVVSGPDSLATWYAHMRRVTVSRGEPVRPGQLIGLVGRLGNATGCHLHFEVHLRNGPIYGADNTDPSRWLAGHAARPA